MSRTKADPSIVKAKVVRKKLAEVRIVISGAGAAGTAITKILLKEAARHIIV